MRVDQHLNVPILCFKHMGGHAFAIVSPKLCNTLQLLIKMVETYINLYKPVYKGNLQKTLLHSLFTRF